jgi:hypothetical protein
MELAGALLNGVIAVEIFRNLRSQLMQNRCRTSFISFFFHVLL